MTYQIRNINNVLLSSHRELLTAMSKAKRINERGRPCMVVRSTDLAHVAYYCTKGQRRTLAKFAGTEAIIVDMKARLDALKLAVMKRAS